MGFYNPRSKSRPGRFERVIDILREGCEPGRLVVLARAVSTPEEVLRVVELRDLEPGGMRAVSAALAEATADLADSAWRDGKSRDDSPWRALWGLAWAHGVHADL